MTNLGLYNWLPSNLANWIRGNVRTVTEDLGHDNGGATVNLYIMYHKL